MRRDGVPVGLESSEAMSQSTITFLILGAVVIVFALDRLPVGIVAIGAALFGRRAS